jgi:hypothetical protein
MNVLNMSATWYKPLVLLRGLELLARDLNPWLVIEVVKI